ncbi:paralemmin-1-like [Embiotoca jacksoni]|uniref:paralemmin-1-like n=1 Tax=Embiotoca jacksoni TaxID=100190 RepID=UPI0037041EBD
MAQMVFHESGQDGRSVLGTLAVQVERDPKTGATVVRSVTTVPTPAGAPKANTIFDDGKKSIHTVDGSVGQPSTEELGQILNVIDGVGMKVLLDEVTVIPNKVETKTLDAETSGAPGEKVQSFTDISEEGNIHLESSGSDHLEAELRIEKCVQSVIKADNETMMAVLEIAGKADTQKDRRLAEEPITLVFLGYADSIADQGHSQEDHEGPITVERVIITEDGEEHILGPETPDSLQSPPAHVAEQEARKESQDEGFHDIPLDGNGAGVKVQGEEGDKGLRNSSSPAKAEGEGTSKRKTCQCCSVM